MCSGDETVYLSGFSARGSPFENALHDLLKKYKTEVDLFIYNDTDDFINAINNEPLVSENTNHNIIPSENGTINKYWYYLNKIIIQPPSEDYPEGKTVKDSITEQIL